MHFGNSMQGTSCLMEFVPAATTGHSAEAIRLLHNRFTAAAHFEKRKISRLCSTPIPTQLFFPVKIQSFWFSSAAWCGQWACLESPNTSFSAWPISWLSQARATRHQGPAHVPDMDTLFTSQHGYTETSLFSAAPPDNQGPSERSEGHCWRASIIIFMLLLTPLCSDMERAGSSSSNS